MLLAELEQHGLTVDAGEGKATSKPVLLTDARHVVLQPLPSQDIIGYLTVDSVAATQVLAEPVATGSGHPQRR